MEEELLKCQNGISKDEDAEERGGRRYMHPEQKAGWIYAKAGKKKAKELFH